MDVCATTLDASCAANPDTPASNCGSSTRFAAVDGVGVGVGVGVGDGVEEERVIASVCELERPARSVAVIAMLFAPAASGTGPSVKVPSAATAATMLPAATFASPDTASVALPLTVTVSVETVAPDGGDVSTSDGGVRSMLTVRVVVALFPARSTAAPLTETAGPSVAIVIGAGHCAMPDSASVHAND